MLGIIAIEVVEDIIVLVSILPNNVAIIAIVLSSNCARDMSGSDDGDVVIVGVAAEVSMESVVLGVAVPPTAFVAVAMMSFFGGVAHVPLTTMLMVGHGHDRRRQRGPRRPEHR